MFCNWSFTLVRIGKRYWCRIYAIELWLCDSVNNVVDFIENRTICQVSRSYPFSTGTTTGEGMALYEKNKLKIKNKIVWYKAWFLRIIEFENLSRDIQTIYLLGNEASNKNVLFILRLVNHLLIILSCYVSNWSNSSMLDKILNSIFLKTKQLVKCDFIIFTQNHSRFACTTGTPVI